MNPFPNSLYQNLELLFWGGALDRQIRRKGRAFKRPFDPAGREFSKIQLSPGLPWSGMWKFRI